MPLLRRASFLGFAAILVAGLASAQSPSSPIQTKEAAFSSSNDSSSVMLAESAAPSSFGALPSAPSPAASSAAGAGQESHGWKQNVASKLALEFGGGFSAPTDKSAITWGGQFTVGGGINLSPRFAVLAEYQFMDNKLPGALIAQTGANGGHAHIWSLTVDPVVSLFPKSSHDLYVTGGGGFYRKVTSFTDPEEAEYCDYYYGYCGVETVNTVVGHFSSNQGGFNIGAGYQHRMGGMYHDSKMKLFVEARFVDVLTPAVNGITPSGLGVTTVAADTKLVPVSVGLRW
jgi:hypothetical protein